MRPPRTAALLTTLATLGVLATAHPAVAERLVTSLSNHQVKITSDYTGEELVLFGSVERDAATVPRRSPYAIVVTVTGPKQLARTRRKERVFGIWMNVESREFIDPPAYLAVLASRPLDTVANAEARRRLRVGLENVQLPQRVGLDIGEVGQADPFRAAFIRIKQERGLYREVPNAVTFLTPNLFRTTIPLPAEVSVGNYEVDVKLFADGAMIARTASPFEIIKVGFEQFVATAAHQYGLLYGLATALMALATGWFASVIFRRD